MAAINRMMCLRTRFCSMDLCNSYPIFSNSIPSMQQQQTRSISKHWNPKFKRFRREKYLKVDLIDFEMMQKYMANKFTPAEIRAFMRQRGAVPYTQDSPAMFAGCTDTIMNKYVPEESDRLGLLTDVVGKGKEKVKKVMSKRQVKKFEDDYTDAEFATEALDIYKEAHGLLTKVFPQNFLAEHRDKTDLHRLHDLVTELAWPEMTYGLTKNGTLVWEYVEALEPPKVVNIASSDVTKKGNKFSQITVRFHSKLIMALYDRFGRLRYGSPTVPKDSLDFIVFEKHLSDTLGRWRIHAKIIPEWETNTSRTSEGQATRETSQ